MFFSMVNYPTSMGETLKIPKLFFPDTIPTYILGPASRYTEYIRFFTLFLFIFLLRLMKKNKIQNLKKPPWNHRLKLGPFLLIDYD